MNKQEIFNGLWTITKEKHNACTADVLSVDKSHPTERGALQVKAGICNVAMAAGLISGSDNAMELMSKRFGNLIGNFPGIAERYRSLPDDQKALMEVALYPEVFMRANFSDKYAAELEMAEREGDPQSIFKAKIKKEMLDEILNMWRAYRVEKGLFVFAFDDKEETK